MYNIEREKKILEILEEKGTIGVNRLAQLLFCSGSTVRRLLTKLEAKGLVKRTFGAVSLSSKIGSEETVFSVRESVNISIKKSLAKTAANLLKSNMIIYIDSSTTLYHISSYLNDYKNLLIITNGLKVALDIVSKTNHKVVVLGGELHTNSNSTLGSNTAFECSKYCVDVALISTTGVTLEFGFSEASLDHAQIKQQMLKNAKRRIVLLDNDKFGITKAFKTCSIDQVDTIIVPNDFPDDIKEKITNMNVEVIKSK